VAEETMALAQQPGERAGNELAHEYGLTDCGEE
jgi:hypothetical protein